MEIATFCITALFFTKSLQLEFYISEKSQAASRQILKQLETFDVHSVVSSYEAEQIMVSLFDDN